MLLSHLYILFIAIAFGCSLFSFKLDYPKHFRFLCVLLGLAVVVEFMAIDGLKAMGIKNNMIVYNPFMLVEFCVYAMFFKMCIYAKWIKRLINAYLIGFSILWFVFVFLIFGIDKWNSYVEVVGSAFTIFFAAFYYYQLLRSKEILSLKNIPEFWVATGVILFYAGNLPYTGMLNFLVQNYSDLASQLTYILKVLNIVMYSLFTYAFLCRTNTTSSKQ